MIKEKLVNSINTVPDRARDFIDNNREELSKFFLIMAGSLGGITAYGIFQGKYDTALGNAIVIAGYSIASFKLSHDKDSQIRRGDAWEVLGGENGDNPTINQVIKVAKAEVDVIRDHSRKFLWTKEEKQSDKLKADSLKSALKLKAPEDYEVLYKFFADIRDHDQGVMLGNISEGSRFGRAPEAVKKRYVQSNSAAILLAGLRLIKPIN